MSQRFIYDDLAALCNHLVNLPSSKSRV